MTVRAESPQPLALPVPRSTGVCAPYHHIPLPLPPHHLPTWKTWKTRTREVAALLLIIITIAITIILRRGLAFPSTQPTQDIRQPPKQQQRPLLRRRRHHLWHATRPFTSPLNKHLPFLILFKPTPNTTLRKVQPRLFTPLAPTDQASPGITHASEWCDHILIYSHNPLLLPNFSIYRIYPHRRFEDRP
jgi:hypothetical protein